MSVEGASSGVAVYFAPLAVAPLFVLARIYPIWKARFQGCDAYNILLNAAALRETKRLPIRVPPVFMLERQEQWYPPGFLIFCALLPEQWLLRRYWLVNHLVDLGSAVLVYTAAVWFGASPLAGVIAMLLYGIAAGAVSEFASLNVRPFGLLLFNALLLSTFAATQSALWFIAVAVLCPAMFYSHKLSAQQLWFTLPVLALATGEWIWLAVLLGVYILAFAIWPRGAWRILRGHWAIIRFWHRNWPWLGAHPVRQSPVYGDGHTKIEYYADESLGGYIAFAKDTFHQNYFIIPLLTALALTETSRQLEMIVLLGWVGSVYVAAVLIHCVTFLRGIGLGRQYVKFALVPSLVFTAVVLGQSGSPAVWIAAVIAVGLSIRQYSLVARALRSSSGAAAVESSDLRQILETLEADKDARILALPVHLCDLVAYRTRRPVYWGTHSDVFDDRLVAFFPVLRRELRYFVHDGVTRLLIDTAYVRGEELALRDEDIIARAGRFVLFRLERAVVRGAQP